MPTILLFLALIVVATLLFLLFRVKTKNEALNVLRWVAFWPLVVLGFILVAVVGNWAAQKVFFVTPHAIFQKYVTSPIPSDVQILTGGGLSWSGYRKHVVFTANPATLKRLLKPFPLAPGCGDQGEIAGVFPEDIALIPDLVCFDLIDGEQALEVLAFWDKKRNMVFLTAKGGK